MLCDEPHTSVCDEPRVCVCLAAFWYPWQAEDANVQYRFARSGGDPSALEPFVDERRSSTGLKLTGIVQYAYPSALGPFVSTGIVRCV